MRYDVYVELWNDQGDVAQLVNTFRCSDPDMACRKASKDMAGIVADSGDPSVRYRIFRVVPARPVRRKK